MIIRYNKMNDIERSRIRSLESKGHIGYIRYLMMRRLPVRQIVKEMITLGLAPVAAEDLKLYFDTVMLPLIQRHKLQQYYRFYLSEKPLEPLSYTRTFGLSEVDRRSFCSCIQEMEIEFFFTNEIAAHYGNRANIPRDENTGKPIVPADHIPNFIEILQHPKRHIIETMIVDGKTPAMIASYLEQMYDIKMEKKEIGYYANAFFKVRRRDLERTIDDLQHEIAGLEQSIAKIRKTTDEEMTIGERSAAIANAKNRIAELTEQVRRLSGYHSHANFNAGVLEVAGVREMFADVMLRAHRRFVTMDERTEDDVVQPLSTIVGMMSKATEKIMALNEQMSAKTKKPINEEMLEVIMPTLERVQEEEKQAYLKYQQELGGELPLSAEETDENVEVLGLDDD